MAWAEADTTRLSDLAGQLFTIPQIASRMGRSYATVYQRAHQFGISLNGNSPEARKKRSKSDEGKWPPERVERLRDLMSVGASSAEAAQQLGCSRSAVIGKCHREGIALMGHQMACYHANKRRAVEGHVRRIKAERRPPRPKAPPRAPRPWEMAPMEPYEGEPMILADMERNQCRYVVVDAGEGHGDEHLFCAAPKLDGSSYCLAHHCRVWVKSERPKR